MTAHAATMANDKSNPVVHFEVLGRDANALRSFYSRAFGWPLGPVDASMEYSMVRIKEAGGIDGGIGKAPQGPGHATFYVGVEDAQAALDRVELLGGRTVVPPTKIPDGITFAVFADPEGHVVGLLAP
jgi:predicted enzyme related to lactoylglutathione lyase